MVCNGLMVDQAINYSKSMRRLLDLRDRRVFEGGNIKSHEDSTGNREDERNPDYQLLYRDNLISDKCL